MSINTVNYPVQESCKACYPRWEGAFVVTLEHEAMKAAIHKALDADVFYSDDMADYVAQELGVTQEQRDADIIPGKTRSVEGGPFAMEVYLARKVVEAERFAVKDAIVRDSLNLSVGQKLGKLKLNDYKFCMGSTIESLTDKLVVLTASRGPQRIRVQCSYTALQGYIKSGKKPTEAQVRSGEWF